MPSNAKELRKKISETNLGFHSTKIFEQLNVESMSRLADEYAQFREETSAGRNLEAVHSWNDKVAERLHALAAY